MRLQKGGVLGGGSAEDKAHLEIGEPFDFTGECDMYRKVQGHKTLADIPQLGSQSPLPQERGIGEMSCRQISLIVSGYCLFGKDCGWHWGELSVIPDVYQIFTICLIKQGAKCLSHIIHFLDKENDAQRDKQIYLKLCEPYTVELGLESLMPESVLHLPPTPHSASLERVRVNLILEEQKRLQEVCSW